MLTSVADLHIVQPTTTRKAKLKTPRQGRKVGKTATASKLQDGSSEDQNTRPTAGAAKLVGTPRPKPKVL